MYKPYDYVSSISLTLVGTKEVKNANTMDMTFLNKRDMYDVYKNQRHNECSEMLQSAA